MDKKDYLQKTFNEVAKGYDHDALSFFPTTAQLMIKYLSPLQDAKLLDVCTGTGVVALEAAERLEGCEITGIDLSEGMLKQAREKAVLRGLNNIDFLQMDLDQLTFPNGHFDGATCSFGLFFLDDMALGLRNIASKVKSGGKIAISSFSEGAFEPMSHLFLERFKAMGYEAPPLSWQKITTDEQLAELFSQASIKNLSIHRAALGFKMASAQDWWDIVWNAGYRGLLRQMRSDELEDFKRAHLEEVQQLWHQGQDWMNTGVVIAVGEI